MTMSSSRGTTISSSTSTAKPSAPGFDLFLFGGQRQFGFGRRDWFVLGTFVEGLDVAHADLGEDLVALFHFVDDPAQGEDNLLGVVDDGHDQVRQGVVLLQLDDLGVDHDEAQLIGRKLVKQRSDDGIDADRFAGAGAAGDEQVRHFREVSDDRMAIDILAQRERDAGLGFAPFFGFEEVAHDDFGLDGIRHLDTDGTFAGHGREDVDAFGLQRGGDVVVERGDFLEADAGAGCNS